MKKIFEKPLAENKRLSEEELEKVTGGARDDETLCPGNTDK